MRTRTNTQKDIGNKQFGKPFWQRDSNHVLRLQTEERVALRDWCNALLALNALAECHLVASRLHHSPTPRDPYTEAVQGQVVVQAKDFALCGPVCQGALVHDARKDLAQYSQKERS
jgi:hypothetical protein